MLPLILLVASVAAAVGFVVGRVSVSNRNSVGANGEDGSTGSIVPASPSRLARLLPRARQALSKRTEKRKTMILEMLRGEARHMQRLTQCNIDPSAEGLTSDDVSLLLRVSRATARKYLNQLENENKILQVGTAGRGVHYVLRA